MGGQNFVVKFTYMPIQYWTIEEKLMVICLIALTIFLYLIRKTPVGFMWRWYKTFWFVLFAYLMIGFAKDKVKNWLKD